MIRATLAALLFAAAPAAAVPDDFGAADIVFLGEVHDNPVHHARQAELVAELNPAALVFEMLDTAQASQVTAELIPDGNALEATLGWSQSGWPDFEMYYPIFREAPRAAYYGAAVPRDEARGVTDVGLAEAFGADAGGYGLIERLPEGQQAEREALQAEAHCDALPVEMLPMMVDIQRLRDARIAKTALRALEETGGPVAVITGNGHARRDWGAPAYVARVAPEVAVAALGQGETSHGAPDGDFDAVEIGPDVDRGDPCAAFGEG